MQPWSGSKRLLYIVNKEGTSRPSMYFSNSNLEEGQQLEEVSGSSPQLGNIKSWSIQLEEGTDKKIGKKSVHSIIKLYPITAKKSSIPFGKNEYVGYDGKRYNIPLTFGLASVMYSSTVKKTGMGRIQTDPDHINIVNTNLIRMLEEDCGAERR